MKKMLKGSFWNSHHSFITKNIKIYQNTKRTVPKCNLSRLVTEKKITLILYFLSLIVFYL